MEHNTRFTTNAGLHQLQYHKLKITSNMRLITHRLVQNANSNVTAHNSWHIYNSFQFSVPILILCSSEIEIYNRHPTWTSYLSKTALFALATCRIDTYSL